MLAWVRAFAQGGVTRMVTVGLTFLIGIVAIQAIDRSPDI